MFYAPRIIYGTLRLRSALSVDGWKKGREGDEGGGQKEREMRRGPQKQEG